MKKIPVILFGLLMIGACGGGNPSDQYDTDKTDSSAVAPAPSTDTSSSTGGDTTMYQRESNKTSDSTQK